MPDSKIDPLDIGALERSVNDSATRVSAIWLSFVAFSAYLAAAVSNISHRQIFLEEPIKLPTINIDLPLVASAILLPLLFVIYHVYVLLQVVLLARTAAAYNQAIERAVPDAQDSTHVRQRLANTLFAQLFAGSPREREGVLGWLLRLMAWITLAFTPVFVLIAFEIKFLPYHSALITWTHRGLIVVDLLAVLLLWAGAVQPGRDIGWRALVSDWKAALGALVIAILSIVLITFPGEPGRLWMAYVAPSDQSSNDIPECQMAWSLGAVVAPSFDRLVLLGEDFVDDEKLGKVISTVKTNGQAPYESERIRSFRSRDLRCARFAGADLRHVDFSESDLSGAVLRGAHLEGATFAGARLAGAVLDNAQLQDASFSARTIAEREIREAELPGAFLRGTQLQRANLKGANLHGANLNGAQLQEANLETANLRGASLKGAALREASLGGAKLQGASLQSAGLQKASLDGAEMQGVSLAGARMSGASLDNAKLHGALLYGTHLQGASFRRTELHGAMFRDAKLEGAAFVEAQLQGVQFERMPLRYVVLSNAFMWRTGRVQCDATHVLEPNWESVVDVRRGRRTVLVPANEQEISAFIEASLKDVPESSPTIPEFKKSELRNDLETRLRGPSDGPLHGQAAWKNCLEASQARTDKGYGELIARILRYACGVVPDRNQVVPAIAQAWTEGKLSDTPVAKTLVASLLEDDEKCPGAKLLDEAARKKLQSVISPGE